MGCQTLDRFIGALFFYFIPPLHPLPMCWLRTGATLRRLNERTPAQISSFSNVSRACSSLQGRMAAWQGRSCHDIAAVDVPEQQSH